MIRLLKTFLVFMRFYPKARPALPKWTPEDAEQLAAFLKSQSGRKLLYLMEDQCAYQNAQCVLQAHKDISFMNGWAGGWLRSFLWLKQLSASLPPQEEEQDSGSPMLSGDELAEKLSA